MKLFALIILAIICYLGYDMYYGKNGYMQAVNTEKKFQLESKKIDKMEHMNQALSDEISDLKKGNKVVEELARSELGMIKENETFYRVIDKDNQVKAPRK